MTGWCYTKRRSNAKMDMAVGDAQGEGSCVTNDTHLQTNDGHRLPDSLEPWSGREISPLELPEEVRPCWLPTSTPGNKFSYIPYPPSSSWEVMIAALKHHRHCLKSSYEQRNLVLGCLVWTLGPSLPVCCSCCKFDPSTHSTASPENLWGSRIAGRTPNLQNQNLPKEILGGSTGKVWGKLPVGVDQKHLFHSLLFSFLSFECDWRVSLCWCLS